MLELNKIYLGDCLDLMPSIADKSVDMVLCDLPYQVLNKDNPNAQWDRIIPFEPLWQQYNRIIKDNGAIVLFAQGMFTAQLMMSNPKMWRYNLIWKKGDRTSGFLNAKRMPMRNHEDICVFYKKQPTYNPHMRQGKPLHSRGKGIHKFTNRNYGSFVETEDLRAGSTEKYPISILNFDRPHPPIHPTQKPVDLLSYLIKTYTNEGDTVLDNCMGSGSTIVAAIKEKRQYIGIEKDEKYFEIAKERIKNETSQLSFF